MLRPILIYRWALLDEVHPDPIDRVLKLWSKDSLTAGATLLLFGVVADVLGARSVNLTGTFLLGLSTLCTGFAKDGAQLITFRALQGVCAAMVNPTCVSILSRKLPSGRIRNLAFGCQSNYWLHIGLGSRRCLSDDRWLACWLFHPWWRYSGNISCQLVGATRRRLRNIWTEESRNLKQYLALEYWYWLDWCSFG